MTVTLPLRTVTPSVSSQRHTVDEASLLRRICVSRPYFALDKLAFNDDTFYAEATSDLPLGLEVGPMGSAEISRHAAIAGLCAAALAQRDDNQRFYLAQRADYSSVPNPAPYGSRVRFVAVLERLDKRGACAHHGERGGRAPSAVAGRVHHLDRLRL